MYLSHFQLQEKPFNVSTDPKFLWVGERHREALKTLKYGILYNDGYAVVTGDVGTGKTTLASALVRDLRDQVTIARMSYPDADTLDFLRLILTTFEIDERIKTRRVFLSRFRSFLLGSLASKKKAVLVIDEAQRLTRENMDELQRLSSIEEHGTPLLTLVFVGQNEFNDLLLEEPNRALRQRVEINYNLLGLTEVETGEYILHRLKVAGCEREIFTPEAVQEVFLFSQGIPRLINIVCDLALLMAYYEKREVVVPETIEQCLERLRLPNEKARGPRSETDRLPAIEEAIQNDNPEKAGEILEKKRGIPGRTKVIFAAGILLLVALLGIVLLFNRPDGGTQRNSTPEAAKQEVPQETRSALESPPLTRAPDSSDQGGEKKVRPQAKPPIHQEKAAAKKTVAPRTPVVEQPSNGKSPSEEEVPSGSIQERPSQRTEDVEHSEVFDWLLERRPNKD